MVTWSSIVFPISHSGSGFIIATYPLGKSSYLLTIRFLAPDFPLLPDVLADATRRHPDRSETPRGLDSTLSPLTELLMVGLGNKGKRPLLMARTKDGELTIYQVCRFRKS